MITISDIVAGISTASTTFKSLTGAMAEGVSLAKTLKGLVDKKGIDADTAEVIVDLHQKLLTASDAQISLKQELEEVREAVTKLQTFERKMKRYKMKTLATGNVVYTLKKSRSNKQPQHSICPYCVNKQVISPLYKRPDYVGLTCGTCQVKIPDEESLALPIVV